MLAALRNRIAPFNPRRAGLAGALIVMAFATPFSALADDICETLRAQLNQPPRTIGNTALVRQFANALTQQNIIIRRIKNDMRSYGCSSGSIIVYGSPNAQLCAEIGDALAQAQAEREMIEDDRNRMLSVQRDEHAEQHREQIMAALDAQGCFARETPDYAAIDPYREPSERTYTDPFNDDAGRDRQDYAPPADVPVQGGLRTLCVRTCDGAFFPISSNATPLDFKAQAAQCQRMCPGAETELFYHALIGQESSDMVSAKTGKPYTSMPTAFAYRNGSAASRSPACGCNMAAYHQEMKTLEQQSSGQQPTAEQPRSSITRLQSPKGDMEENNAHVPSTPKTEATAAAVPERDYDPKNSNVRVVGPQFLPEETSRIDLKNPALKGAQPQQE